MIFQPATENWRMAKARFELARENEMSRRLYRVLLRWLPFADAQYRDWEPESGEEGDGWRPNCGHFFGGSFWYASDNASTGLVFAVLAKLGEYDESVTGIPRKRVLQRAIRSLRYMGFTHDTGPADCVRVRGTLPYTSGKKWGGSGDHFFLASQNGRSIAAMAITAQLLWDDLDAETRLLVQNVVASYADRWAEEEPRNGVYYDTQCEENAWTAAGISAGMTLFPEHPHREVWRKGFVNWAMNAVTTFRDRLAYPSGLVDVTDGFSVKTATFHPDYTAENHAFVHPSYLCAGTNLRALHAVAALTAGLRPDPAALHNNVALYERTIKPWAQFDGLAVPVQGQDWWYNRQHERLLTHSVLNVLHGDADAAALAREALRSVERIQASNGRGCLLEENGEACVINRAHGQFARDLEHGSAVDLAAAYLLYAFGGEGAAPSDPGELTARLAGVYEYPYGSAIVYRTKDAFASFSWRNNTMALTLPKNGVWSITPLYASYTGTVLLEPAETERTGPTNEDIVRTTEYARAVPYGQGFGAVATIARGGSGAGLLQDVSFTALPDGCTVYAERFRAERDSAVREAATGLVGVRNELYGAMPELAPGARTLTAEGGAAERFEGFYGREPNRERRFGKPGYVNVDGQMGFVLFGTAGVRYINKHEYPKWKGIEDILILNDIGPFRLQAGEKTPPFAVLTLPNRSAEETADAHAETVLLETAAGNANVDGDGDTLLLETANGYLVYVRFGRAGSRAAGRKPLRGPIVRCYDGTQRIREGVYEWSATLPGGVSGFRRARFELRCEAIHLQDLEIAVVEDRAYVTNRGSGEAQLELLCGGSPIALRLPAGALSEVHLG